MNIRSRSYRWLLLIALVLLEVVACKPASPVFLDSGPLVPARVIRVTDGDSIEIRMDGTNYKITYLGIDAPETGDDARPGEILGDGTFGAKASQRNKELVGGQTVYLEKDVRETDGRDALLRYVWLEDGKMVNSLLVAEGYAKTAIIPSDTLYAEQLLTLEEEARRKSLGLWAFVPKEESATDTGP